MRPLPLFFMLLPLGLAACGNSNDLGTAAIPNVERIDSLWALEGTPVSTSSGFSVEGGQRVRTDLTVQFDFAYNVEASGQHVFIPLAAFGIDTANTVKPGLVARSESFEAISNPPGGGFTTDAAVPIAPGQRFVVRSRITCSLGVPKYAKLEILGFNDVTRVVSFRVLVNDNCGFRSLEPGLPDQ